MSHDSIRSSAHNVSTKARVASMLPFDVTALASREREKGPVSVLHVTYELPLRCLKDK